MRRSSPLLLALALSAPAPRAQVFQGLGDLPGGSFQSAAYDVSTDGRVVVGASRVEGGGDVAYRWTAAAGMVALGVLPGVSGSNATGVSSDGAFVVGASVDAYRWTAATGMVALARLPDAAGGQGQAVSDDGAVVVGSGYFGYNRAARWVNGAASDLGDLGGGSATAYGVSADGSVVVGEASTSASDLEAFRWVNGTMTGLGTLGFEESRAFAVSADGSVVVGGARGPGASSEAFRWVAGVMTGLGTLPGNPTRTWAKDVSDDGAVVVGLVSGGDGGSEAFVWTEARGMRALAAVLEEDYGVDLSGWTLGAAEGVSADGTVIVGTGQNPQGQTEAWRVDLGAAVWLDPVSGFFNEPTRWSILDIPDEQHAAVFNAPTTDFYAVTFVQGEATRSLAVDSSLVTLDLGGATYTLTEATPADALRVGLTEGRPSVLALDGGTLAAGNAVVGEGPGSEGGLHVGDLAAGGPTSALTLAGLLTVGRAGAGRAEVNEGGTLTAELGLTLGEEAGSEGEIVVATLGVLQVPEGVRSVVGAAGRGTLHAFGSTLTLTGPAVVGEAASGNGTLRLSLSASGTTQDTLVVGFEGTGGLEVVAGAALTSADAVLGHAPGSIGTALVAGAGARWEVAGHLQNGLDGAALIQVQDGGTLRLNDYAIGPQGTLDATGGVLCLGTFCAPPPALGDVPFVQAQTLLLADGAEVLADALVLEEGGTLGGDGTLALPVTNTGTLAPGRPGAPGTFTLDAAYTQAPGGTLAVDLGGTAPGTGHDRLAVAGAATLGGTLRLARLPDHVPAVGDAYTLLTAAAVTGAFAAVEAPPDVALDVAYAATAVTATVTDVWVGNEPAAPLPADVLHPPAPNPARGPTTLRYDVAGAGRVRLAVHDALGREVAVLVDAEHPAGRHEAVFDGATLAPGLYLVRMTGAAGFTQARRVTLLR